MFILYKNYKIIFINTFNYLIILFIYEENLTFFCDLYLKIRCKKCGDILVGDKKGTFIECSCRSIAIDETKCNTRLIGESGDYEEVE